VEPPIGNRTDDLRITRGTIPVRARASCTDSRSNRTDSTPWVPQLCSVLIGESGV
jgi:hypothetical protein